jgi:hypothetical protein
VNAGVRGRLGLDLDGPDPDPPALGGNGEHEALPEPRRNSRKARAQVTDG